MTPRSFRLIDLSQPVFQDCPNSPADPPVRSELLPDPDGEGWQTELLTLTSHTGTHVDAPLHKIPGGTSIEALDLQMFVGPAVVADLRDSRPDQPFTSTWLSRRLRITLEDRIILLATGWGSKRGPTDEWRNQVPYVSPDGAEWLVEQRIRGVGIDHHSIGGTRKLQNRLTHELLLKAGIWIVEDLFLPDELLTLPAPLQYWGLPINLRGHSGAFCRPVIVVG